MIYSFLTLRFDFERMDSLLISNDSFFTNSVQKELQRLKQKRIHNLQRLMQKYFKLTNMYFSKLSFVMKFSLNISLMILAFRL